MKQEKKRADAAYRIRLLRMMSLYAVIMLAMLAAAILIIPSRTQALPEKEAEAESTDAETEYIYIRADSAQDSGDSTAAEETVYTVREYRGQIGIFLSDGTLMDVLDVNIKSLPEADRRLLGEGIEVLGKKRLNSLIEDYTG